jgi:plastocyanin
MKKGNIIIIGILLVILGLILFFNAKNESNITYKESGVLLSGKSIKDYVYQIQIKDNKFIPNEIVIEKGERVSWINYDGSFHAIVSKDNLFESKKLFYEQSFSYIFKEKGEYEYHGKYNPDVKGKIIVK